MSNKSFARASTPSLLHAPRTPRFLLAGGLAACALVLPQAAFGADRTWNGGGLLNNNWSNNNNWAGSGGISPLDSLFFGGTNGLTNNNNTAAGTQYNGLTFNSGAGTFILGGNWIKLGGNVTNNSTATQTINFGMELVGADRTFNAASGDLVLNGSISGNQGIVKTGAGTLWLGGANTYSGGTTINAGTVDVASSLGLGTGQVTFGDTGTLVLRDQASAYTNAVQVSAGKTAKIDTAGNPVTFGGAISGAGTFEKVGYGLLRLAGVNTSTGGTKLTYGTLQIDNHLALGDSSNALTVNGGYLDLRDSSVHVGALSGTGGVITSTFDNGEQSDVYLNTTVAAGTTSTFSGSLQSGVRTLMRLQKEGAGTLVLNGTNDMSDAQINAGTLEFGRTDALAHDNFIGNGATLRAGVGGTVGRNVVLNSSSDRGTFDTQNFDINLSGSLVGGGTLVKSGSGRLTLSGWNVNFGGSFEIDAGTLETGGANAFYPNSRNALKVNGGTFSVGNFDTTIGALSGGSGGTVTTSGTAGTRQLKTYVDAGTSRFDGRLVDNGPGKLGLEKRGTGVLELYGAGSSYSGGTKVVEGTLAVTDGGLYRINALGTGGVEISNGVLRFDSNGLLDNRVTVAGTDATIDTNGHNVILNQSIGGNGLLSKKGLGSLWLRGTQSLANLSLKMFEGVLEAGTNSLSNVSFRGNSTISAGQSGTFASGSVNVASGVTAVISTNGYDVAILGALDGVGGSAQLPGNTFQKDGYGTLTISGPWNFGGLTEVWGGTLKLGPDTFGLPSRRMAGGAIVHGGATLDVEQAGPLSVTGLTVNGTVRSATGGASGSWLTVGGTLDGLGSIVGNLRSAGILDGSHYFTGNVVVAGQHFAGGAGVHSITGNLEYATVSGISSVPSVAWALFSNSSSNAGLAPWNARFDQALVSGNLAFSSATSLSLAFNGIGSTVNWGDAFWSTDRSWTIWQVEGSTTGLANLTLGLADWKDAGGNLLSALRSGAGFSFGLAGNGRDVVLTYSAVPAPGALGLLALAGLAGARRRRA